MSWPDVALAAAGLIGGALVANAEAGHLSALAVILLALVPLVVALILAFIVRRLRKFIAFFRLLLNIYRLQTAANIETSISYRVENANGDARYSRKYKYLVVRDKAPIRASRREALASPVPLKTVPPVPIIQKPNSFPVQLRPVSLSSTVQEVDGIQHHRYEWQYEFRPPLQAKGQELRFEYEVDLPGAEASAFSEEGTVFFLWHEVPNALIQASLIGPSGFNVVVLKTWSEDYAGHINEMPDSEKPVYIANQSGFAWTVAPRAGARVACRYRFQPTSKRKL